MDGTLRMAATTSTKRLASAPESRSPSCKAQRSALLKPHMPGLDILRGIAILSVVLYHGLFWGPLLSPPRNTIWARLAGAFTFGWLGVFLFFVLSGFLITGILLDSRQQPFYWRNFYVKRALRILPAFFAVIFLI